MKKLITLITALCMAITVSAAPKKDEKGKDDKSKKKEAPVLSWDVVIEGATTETATQEVKAMLADVKGLKVESIEQKESNIEAVVCSTQRFSRSDISRAIKGNKAYKLKEFKARKPEKEGDKKEEPKKEEPKKEEPAKTEPEKKPEEKPEAPKAGDAKPATEKPADPKKPA